MRLDSVIIGFGHQARQGKDEAVAAIIAARSGQYDVRRYAFGTELKREVNKSAMNSGGMLKLFDDGLRCEGCGYMQENGNVIALPDWVQYDWNPPMDDPDCPYGKQRTLLQWWGTEYRRNVNENYWLNKVAERIAEEKPEIALITDVRFPNEKAFCEKYGESIKVVRTGYASDVPKHISELALAHVPDDQWSDVIYNDRGLEELRQLAVFTFDELMERTVAK